MNLRERTSASPGRQHADRIPIDFRTTAAVVKQLEQTRDQSYVVLLRID